MAHQYLSRTADMTPHFDRIRRSLATGPAAEPLALTLFTVCVLSFAIGVFIS